MLNTVNLIGRLVRKAEAKKVGEHTAATFTLAADGFSKGEKVAYFFNCVAWNQTAKVLLDYTDKGSLIAVSGRLTQRTYQNKKDETVNVVEILVNDISLLDPKKQEDKNETTDASLPF